VRLPRWTGYDAACPSAQQEWDRFMTQTRAHEQQEHVNMARNFVDNLGEDDTVITGSSVADLQNTLQAKHQELADRLQALHDACDHGAAIDALLHPENGV
jgi:predicted secreted Zn-dependent protease